MSSSQFVTGTIMRCGDLFVLSKQLSPTNRAALAAQRVCVVAAQNGSDCEREGLLT